VRKNREQRTENREQKTIFLERYGEGFFSVPHQRPATFDAILCYNNIRENTEQSNLEQSMSGALLLDTAFVRSPLFVLSICSFCNNIPPTYPGSDDNKHKGRVCQS